MGELTATRRVGDESGASVESASVGLREYDDSDNFAWYGLPTTEGVVKDVSSDKVDGVASESVEDDN